MRNHNCYNIQKQNGPEKEKQKTKICLCSTIPLLAKQGPGSSFTLWVSTQNVKIVAYEQI